MSVPRVGIFAVSLSEDRPLYLDVIALLPLYFFDSANGHPPLPITPNQYTRLAPPPFPPKTEFVLRW